MNGTSHPHAQLSAYLDGALAPAERAAVAAHLDGCAACRDRLAELRATAALIRSLPAPVPSRRLVPRTSAPPMWLAPLRTLTTLASGLSVFLFIASAVLTNIDTLAAPTLMRPGDGAAAAPAATGAAPEGARSTSAPGAQADTAVKAASPTAAARSATDSFAGASPTPAPPADAVRSTREAGAPQRRPAIGDPWLWLALAVITGAAAFAMQRRLRSA